MIIRILGIVLILGTIAYYGLVLTGQSNLQFFQLLKFHMKWPPTLCWTSPKTINGNRHFQVKAYGGKNEDRWVDIFPTKNKKDIKRILWAKLKSEWTSGWLRLPKDKD